MRGGTGGAGKGVVLRRQTRLNHRRRLLHRHGAQNGLTGRAHVYRAWPVVRGRREPILGIRRKDGDDVVRAVAGRIDRNVVNVDRIIPGGRHDHDVFPSGLVNRVLQALAVVRATPRHVDHLGPACGLHGVLDGRHGRVQIHPIGVGHLQGHQADLPGHARYADHVIGKRADDAGRVRAVIDVVDRVRGIVEEVVSIEIIHVPVPVVILTGLAKHLGVVHPEVHDDLRVLCIDAGINNRHNQIAATGGKVPRLRRTDHLEGPLLRKHRIVRRLRKKLIRVVGFGVQDILTGRELEHGVHDTGALGQRDQRQAGDDIVVLMRDGRPFDDPAGDRLAHRARSPRAIQVRAT